MFKRQTSGSVMCPACGRLVGVQAEACPHCGRRNPSLWGFSRTLQLLGQEVGFVYLIIGGCAVLYILSLVTDPAGVGFSGLLSILSPSARAVVVLGASGSLPVYDFGRWWTVLSATWLHGSLLHILFNMYWVRMLGPTTARLYGPARMMIIYLVSGATGFLLSSTMGAFGGFLPPPLAGAGLTLGASGAIFGLLGALVLYGRRGGSAALGQQAWGMAVMIFIFGFIMPGVDNFAHLGGFLGGYLTARWLDPLKEEQPDHLFVALIGLGLTLVAIVASVLLGRSLL